MPQEFDKDYWETHWQEANARGSEEGTFPNPYLAHETSPMDPGTALDAGCGQGAEAIWLASEGWQVTAVDISSEALSRAAERERRFGVPRKRVRWIEADLRVWEPDTTFDLVTTHYAHPAMPQLDFFERISRWVAPLGSLIIIGHLRSPGSVEPRRDTGHGKDDGHPPEATVDAESISSVFEAGEWKIVTAAEPTRTVTRGGGREAQLHDVVVSARRR